MAAEGGTIIVLGLEHMVGQRGFGGGGWPGAQRVSTRTLGLSEDGVAPSHPVATKEPHFSSVGPACRTAGANCEGGPHGMEHGRQAAVNSRRTTGMRW